MMRIFIVWWCDCVVNVYWLIIGIFLIDDKICNWHESWFMIHDSWFMIHGLWFVIIFIVWWIFLWLMTRLWLMIKIIIDDKIYDWWLMMNIYCVMNILRDEHIMWWTYYLLHGMVDVMNKFHNKIYCTMKILWLMTRFIIDDNIYCVMNILNWWRIVFIVQWNFHDEFYDWWSVLWLMITIIVWCNFCDWW
jgi:hypothetical protein